MNTYYRLIQVYYRFATNLHKLTTAHDDGENQNCRQASISITRAKSMKMGFKETESNRVLATVRIVICLSGS